MGSSHKYIILFKKKKKECLQLEEQMLLYVPLKQQELADHCGAACLKKDPEYSFSYFLPLLKKDPNRFINFQLDCEPD
jgi:hypothetical protein